MRLFALLLTLLYCNLLQGQDIILTTEHPAMLSLCENEKMDYGVENISLSVISDLDISLDLPNDIKYVPGSATLMTEVDISDLQHPIFRVDDVLPMSKILIGFEIETDCEIYDIIQAGMEFENVLNINHPSTSFAYTSDLYAIDPGLLVITDFQDRSATTNTTFTREVTISNGRLGRISSFIYENIHDAVALTSTNGTILEETNTTLRLEFDADDFRAIGNGDDYFDLDEELVITEEIRHEECEAEIIGSQVTVAWGCDGMFCQSDTALAELTMVPTIGEARLRIETEGDFPFCPCLPGGYKQCLTIENVGDASTEDLVVTIDIADIVSVVLGGIENSFVIDSGNAMITSVKYDSLTENDCSSPLKKFTKAEVTIRDIGPDEKIKLCFDFLPCFSQFGANENEVTYSYDYSMTFKTLCKPFSEEVIRPRTIRFTEEAVGFDMKLLSEDVNGDVYDDSTYIYEWTATGAKLRDTGYICLDVCLPCGLYRDGAVQTNVPTKLISEEHVDSFGSNAYYFCFELPVDTDSLIVSLPIYAQCDTPCIVDLGIPQNIFYESSCPEEIMDKSSYSGLISGGGFASFCPPDLRCGFGLENFVSYDMNCPSSSRYDTVLAYVDFDGGTRRISLDFKDGDDNRIAEIGKADETEIQTNYVVITDTLVHEYKGEVIVDNNDGQWDSLVFSLTTGSDLTMLYAEFEFKDFESGERFNFRLDSFQRDKGGVSPGLCQIVVSQPNFNVFQVEITEETLLEEGHAFPDFELTDGDSIYCKIYTRNDVHYKETVLSSIVQRVHLFDRLNKKYTRFSCGAVGELISLSGLVLSFSGDPNIVVDVCGENESYGGWKLYPTDISDNLFDFEFRHYLQFTELGFIVPQEFIIDSVEILVTYRKNNMVTDSFVYHFPVTMSGDTFYVDSQDLATVVHDEGYFTDIKPFVKLRNCSVGPDGSIPEITIFTTFEGVNGFQFGLSPATHTPRPAETITTSQRLQIDYPEVIMDFGSDVITATNRKFCRTVYFQLTEQVQYLEFLGLLNNDDSAEFEVREQGGLELQTLNGDLFFAEEVNFGEYYFDICMTSDYCDRDTLSTTISWACLQEGGGIKEVCYDTTLVFEVRKTNAEMELDLRSNSEVQLCDTTEFISVDLINGDLGWSYDVKLNVLMPIGLEFIPNQIEVEYPVGSGWRPMPLPNAVAGRAFQWDMTAILTTDDKGLPGLNELPQNRIKVRMKLLTACELGVGKVVTFWTEGTNPCGTKTNVVRKSTAPFSVEGLTQKFQADIALSQEREVCEDQALIRFEMTTNLTTLGGELVEIILPKPLRYIPQSMVPIEGIEQQEPTVVDSGDVCRLIFVIEESISTNEKVIFEYTVGDLTDVSCGEHLIFGSVKSKEEAICVALGEPCATFVENGSTELIFEKTGYDVGISNFEVIDSMDGLFYKLNLDIPGLTDTSGLLANLRIYSDENRNSILDTTDVHLMDWATSLNVNSGQVDMLCWKDESGYDGCHWLVVIEGPCICISDTMEFMSSEIEEFDFCDTICSGDSLMIGRFISSGEEAIWQSVHEICDTCDFQRVSHSHNDDSLRIYRYTLDVINADQCGERYHYEVKVAPEPPAYTSNLSACPGDTVRLEAREVADWSGSGLNEVNKKSVEVIVMDSDDYRAEYLDEFGCLVTHDFRVEGFDTSHFYQIISDTLIAPGDSVQLTVDPIPDSILWSPRAGLSCFDCPAPWAVPDTTVTYRATIFDENGCPIILSVTVRTAIPPCRTAVYVPNAFSPNGDGINEVWGVRGRFVERIHVVVYDRWGEEVFESTVVGETWDGTFNGALLEPDVFAFAVTVDCADGDTQFIKGNVTLVR